jgi:hypothetical protein
LEILNWVWWHTPVILPIISALRKLRQKDLKLETSLSYKARPVKRTKIIEDFV